VAVESYYLETQDGLFFAVKGLEHPPGRWIAVLRYAPDPEAGERMKDGVSYRRLYRFSEQEKWIREMCPQYSEYDPVFQATLQSVPRYMVRRIYDPRRRFQDLMQASGRNALEEDAVAFLSVLHKEAAVPLEALGITGSMLIGLHTESSDMDVAVFGEANCFRVYRALRRLLDGGTREDLGRLDAKGMEELYAQRAVDTKMDYLQFKNLEKEKVNQGRFRERAWFVRFVKDPEEARNTYGKLRYMPLGRMNIQAFITDDRDAIFTPCRYALSEACSVEGERKEDLNEIVSFRGRFCEQARVGDRIMAAGTLERIQDCQGVTRHRLLLGNSPEDTMVVMH
jgi:predicted nucleotidyltransferase